MDCSHEGVAGDQQSTVWRSAGHNSRNPQVDIFLGDPSSWGREKELLPPPTLDEEAGQQKCRPAWSEAQGVWTSGRSQEDNVVGELLAGITRGNDFVATTSDVFRVQEPGARA